MICFHLKFRFDNLLLVVSGAGAMVSAIETGAGRRATVVGKPCAPMFDFLLHKWQCSDPSKLLMVGDR